MVLRVVAAAAVIAALAFGLIALLGEDDDEEATVKGPPGNDFTLVQPDGWTVLSDEERGELPGNPLVVMRRGEGEGLLIVDAPSDTERDLDAVSESLDKRLEKAIPDFRKASARVVEVEAGRALLYSYARGRKATAHTILVVPTDDRTYTLNAAIPAGAEEAAREVGRILFSFDL
jgi:hypothetical protein